MECSGKTKGKRQKANSKRKEVMPNLNAPKAKGDMYMFKSKFQIEDGPIYDGYTNGNHWNGWACPWFTKEVADQIAMEVNADAPYCTMHYDKVNDAFVYKANGDDECVYKANEKGLYPIGNGYWRWDDLSEMESEV